jgi:hypothetical protein
MTTWEWITKSTLYMSHVNHENDDVYLPITNAYSPLSLNIGLTARRFLNGVPSLR